MEKKQLLLIFIIISLYYLLKKSDKEMHKYIIICVLLLSFLIYKSLDDKINPEQVLNNIKKNYIVSVIVGKVKDTFNSIKGAYLDIYNNGIKTLFVPTEKGKSDKLLVKSKKDNKLIDVADKTGLSSKNHTHGCISLDLDKDGYSDLLVARDDGVTLYKNIKGTGQFKAIKLLENNENKSIGLLLSDLSNKKQVLHTSDFENLKENKDSKMINLNLSSDGDSKLLSVTNNDILNHMELKNQPNAYHPDHNIKYFEDIKDLNEHFSSSKDKTLQLVGPVEIKNNNYDEVDWQLKSCIKNLEYKRLNNLDRNYSLGSKLTEKNRRSVVNLMKLEDYSPSFIANYNEGARGSNYYKVDVNAFKAPINIGNKLNDWKNNTCVNNLEYKKSNNINTNYSLGNNFPKGEKKNVTNLLLSPDNFSDKISYNENKRGNNKVSNLNDTSCVLNRDYTPQNNKNKNYLHNLTKYALTTDNEKLLNKKLNKTVNLIKHPNKTNLNSVSYHSMNRLQ